MDMDQDPKQLRCEALQKLKKIREEEYRTTTAKIYITGEPGEKVRLDTQAKNLYTEIEGIWKELQELGCSGESTQPTGHAPAPERLTPEDREALLKIADLDYLERHPQLLRAAYRAASDMMLLPRTSTGRMFVDYANDLMGRHWTEGSDALIDFVRLIHYAPNKGVAVPDTIQQELRKWWKAHSGGREPDPRKIANFYQNLEVGKRLQIVLDESTVAKNRYNVQAYIWPVIEDYWRRDIPHIDKCGRENDGEDRCTLECIEARVATHRISSTQWQKNTSSARSA